MSGVGIRPYEPALAEALHEAIQESVADVGRWLPWCRREYSLEQASQWIATHQDLMRKGQAYEFAILDGERRYLGGCGLNQLNAPNRFANLGYWVRTSAMGRGVAPVAARLVADFAFANTDLVRLEIVCAVDNVRSQRVAERVGAVREGVLRSRVLLPSGPSDAVMYSLVRP